MKCLAISLGEHGQLSELIFRRIGNRLGPLRKMFAEYLYVGVGK